MTNTLELCLVVGAIINAGIFSAVVTVGLLLAYCYVAITWFRQEPDRLYSQCGVGFWYIAIPLQIVFFGVILYLTH